MILKTSTRKTTASKNAHKSNGMIGHIFEREFKSMVRNNMIQNCPITASDVTSSQNMFGPKLTGTRGKTVQQNMDIVVMDYVAVPKDFIKLHKFLALVEYTIFVNGAPLLITIPRVIKFVMV